MLEVVTPLLLWASPVLAILAATLLVVGIKKLLDKVNLHLNGEQEALLEKYVKIGVGYAENWALSKVKNGEDKPTSQSKLGKAVNTVMTELDRAGITKVATEVVIGRIEAYLHGTNTGKV